MRMDDLRKGIRALPAADRIEFVKSILIISQVTAQEMGIERDEFALGLVRLAGELGAVEAKTSPEMLRDVVGRLVEEYPAHKVADLLLDSVEICRRRG